MKVNQSVVLDSATPRTVAHQAPLSMGLSRQEYWSGLPFHSPGEFPNPGFETGSPALQVDSLPSEPPGKPKVKKPCARDFTFTFHFHALEKEMATHSSVLAWKIPRTGKPGGLPFMGLHRVGHD